MRGGIQLLARRHLDKITQELDIIDSEDGFLQSLVCTWSN